MKYIEKSTSPESLEEYKKLSGACFADLPTKEKDELRDSLWREQGGICCYCTGELKERRTVIEHYLPKDVDLFPELQLEYTNLLLSCDGGQEERKKHNRRENKNYPTFCDAHKNNTVIKVCPTDISCENQFAFDDEGEIYGLSDAATYAIEVLNLNIPFLRNQRKAAIENYKVMDMEPVDWEHEIDMLLKRDSNERFMPYCIAIVYYIRNFKMLLA